MLNYGLSTIEYGLSMFSKKIKYSQDQGHTLYRAIQSGNQKIVFNILSNPDYIDLKDIRDLLKEKSINPLLLAVPYSNILKKFLEHYNEQIPSIEKITALNTAIQNNHEKSLSIILSQCRQDISSEDIIQALIAAVKSGYVNILNILLNEPSASSLAAYQNNIVLKEAQNLLNISNNKNEKKIYKTIINRLMQIPSIVLIKEVEDKKNTKKIEDILSTHFDSLNAECIGFSLVKAAEVNFPQAIAVLLQQPHHQIKDYHKGFSLMRAIEKVHPECVDTLLSHDTIARMITWHNHAPLHEAIIQLNKSEGRNKKNHLSILKSIKNTYDKIWNNSKIDSLETQHLKLKIIIDHMRERLIISNKNDSIASKVNRLDVKILKYIQQKTNNSNEESNEIILNQNEINNFLDTFTLSDTQLNNFINETKLYFKTADIESFTETSSQEGSRYELSDFEIKSYSDFIRICANNLLKIFPKTISEIAQSQLDLLDTTEKLITPCFNDTFLRKRLHRESDAHYDNAPPSKRRRLA